jgi:hypothetical protein
LAPFDHKAHIAFPRLVAAIIADTTRVLVNRLLNVSDEVRRKFIFSAG